jgi:hypothetical protein
MNPLDALELKGVITRLAKLRKEYAELVNRRTRKQIRRNWMMLRLAQLEAPIIKQVCEETTMSSTGRTVSKYGNETERKNEIETRLARSPEISGLIKSCELSRKLLIADLQYEEALGLMEIRYYETAEQVLLLNKEMEVLNAKEKLIVR